MKRLLKALVGFFAVLTCAVAMVALFYFTAWARETAPAIKIDSTPIVRDARAVTSFAPVVKKAAPSVVNIFSTHIVHLRRNRAFDDPFFRQFFGDPSAQDNGTPRERIRRIQSLGSGIIISPDGFILTANHVVDGMDEIKVAIPDSKTEYTAKIVGNDPVTDVAVLKIDGKNLPAITFGDSDQLEVGDVVLAIGNPFRVGRSVTMGIVSALGRKVDSTYRGYAIQNFIQTDAAINPGNSGGALVDAEGRLIGINTSIITDESLHGYDVSGNEGVGFAVPINLARSVMDRLISGGKVTRGYLGIHMQDADADLAPFFNLSNQNGALVDDVFPGTPADKAGIKPGDFVIEFNGKKVDDGNSLQLAISECAPGSEATVKLISNGAVKSLTVKLAELPVQVSERKNDQTAPVSTKPDALDGVTVADLDREVRLALRTPASLQGTLVAEVNPSSNAAEAGLLRGDIIVEINRQPVRDADTAVKLCEQAKGKRILVRVWRREGEIDGTRWLTVDNTKRK
ncbi:MAG: Do family serine endopeptidase [Verrucomicrobiota bacterium]